MKAQVIVDNIQSTLADKGVYRTDTFVLAGVNDGYRLVALLTMFDERRASISVNGARNFVPLPKSGTAEMFAPIYLSNGPSGNRVNPADIQKFEFYSFAWEGNITGADGQYYVVFSPYHNAECMLCVVPVQNTATQSFTIVGAYIPTALGLTDVPRLPETFQDILYYYGVFHGFLSEPNRGQEATQAYGQFVTRVNELTAMIKSRFPSNQGYKPRPVEFVYDIVTRQQQKDAEPKETKRESQ